MTTSDTRTKHIEVPTDLFELPAVQAYAAIPFSGGLSAIAKTIGGTGRKETLLGTDGSDVIRAGNGNDIVFGLRGNDKLYGQNGRDALWGGAGKDQLDGGDGLDNLFGEDGNDKLYGRAGDDFLVGGKGADTLTGGAGGDTFQVDLGGVDRIMDFESGMDRVNLLFFVESIGEDEFVLGTAAKDANDRVIYDQTTGYLYYDADGNGAGAAVLFAINVRKSAMVFYDF
ncbi:calcium-binding protein [Microvirga subterranea]|uniref:Hemolysin type calcium-binding protein n=1 Tax=Microvirga subterranea TaxID=186651 RepID=A0A370HL29_9HYPH|nr:calcium-binding protein [Microvirga subterranea]RDI56418.1 hemolysin type calcium-binding protein [Microvirga subterranea]